MAIPHWNAATLWLSGAENTAPDLERRHPMDWHLHMWIGIDTCGLLQVAGNPVSEAQPKLAQALAAAMPMLRLVDGVALPPVRQTTQVGSVPLLHQILNE